jgi:hypothetical protein
MTGTPTAFYNKGLAWPENEKALREVLKERDAGIFSWSEAESSNVSYLLTDSSCPAAWHTTVGGTIAAEKSYSADDKLATVTLLKLAR